MRTAWIIARRDVGAQFRSPIAYIVVSAFVVLTGLLFFNDFFRTRTARMDSFFGILPWVYLLFAPALAMRSVAEERGRGTVELLLTMPVRDWEVVVGKYLAAMSLLALGLLCTLPFAFTVAGLGDLDLGPVIGGYVGALLLGGVYIAAGLLASTATRDQVIAFVVGLVLCFLLFAIDWLVDPAGATLGAVIEYASPRFHFGNLTRGLLEWRGLIYFASMISAFLLLSIQALESRKWR